MRNQPRCAESVTTATLEKLEDRRFLSAVAPFTATATTTTLTLSTTSSTLGQPVMAKVDVTRPKGGPQVHGTIIFEENGSPIDTLAGTPLAVKVTNGKASYDFSPGDIGLDTGTQSLEAVFASSNSNLSGSTSTAQTVTVAAPTYTTTADGLEEATVVTGHGKAIASGKTAHVLYTGFLESNGEIFDYASAHNTKAKKFVLAYKVGAGAVVAGFDEGTVGMQVGETRVLVVPPSLGYGSTQYGDIPPNSTLVFLVTLKKITNKAPKGE